MDSDQVTAVLNFNSITASIEIFLDGSYQATPVVGDPIATNAVYFREKSRYNFANRCWGEQTSFNGELQGLLHSGLLTPQFVSHNNARFKVTNARFWIDSESVFQIAQQKQQPS
jgi:hypothetical protein